MYPPQSYMLIAGDLHQKMFLIKRGYCVEVDILGNHILRGPGDLVNFISAVAKFQMSTVITITHVHCYEFDKQFYAESQKQATIFDIQRKFPSFKIAIEKILLNVFKQCDFEEHGMDIQLDHLEKRYAFDKTQRQPCSHLSKFRSVIQFTNRFCPFGNISLAWNIFIILVNALTALLGLQSGVSMLPKNSLQKCTSILDCFLFLDCYIRLQTPYFDNSGNYITDFSMVIKRWIREYCLNDFCLLFPFDMLIYLLWKLEVLNNNLGRMLISYG